MNRFNYLADPRRSSFEPLGWTIAVDNRIRGPLAALVATVILTGILGVVQLTRLHAAQRAYAMGSAQLEAGNADRAAINELRERVTRKTRYVGHVTDIRQITLKHANELAWIGNRLPAQTWLRSLRYEHGSYSLEGDSAHVAAVGSAMLALRDSARGTVPQLVTLHDDASAAGARVRYTLRLAARP